MNVKRAAEARLLSIDFETKLSVDEVLTGTPTVAEVTSTDLTITGVALTVSPAGLLKSGFIPTSHGVQFVVSGGVAGTTYTIRVTAVTNATYPQTLIKDVQLRVN